MAVGTALTPYASNLALDKLFRNVDFTIAAWYVGILNATVPSSDSGTFVEVTANSYTRRQVTFSPASASQIRNNIAVDWGTLAESWGSMYGLIVTDSSDLSSYNMLAYGAINNGPKTMNAGQNPRIAVASLTIVLD